MPEAKVAAKPAEKKEEAVAKPPTMKELMAAQRKIAENVEKEQARNALAELQAKAGQ